MCHVCLLVADDFFWADESCLSASFGSGMLCVAAAKILCSGSPICGEE